MKSKMMFFVIVAIAAGIFSCSDDNEVKRKGDPDITHEGEKWTISSIDTYTLMSVMGTSVVNKTGSKANAGSFYFVEAENKGSFEMEVEGFNKEDFFNFSIDETDGSINIVTVQQSVGATTNQNIVAISGQQTSETEIVLDVVSITKQSTSTGMFSLSAITMTLVKN